MVIDLKPLIVSWWISIFISITYWTYWVLDISDVGGWNEVNGLQLWHDERSLDMANSGVGELMMRRCPRESPHRPWEWCMWRNGRGVPQLARVQQHHRHRPVNLCNVHNTSSKYGLPKSRNGTDLQTMLLKLQKKQRFKAIVLGKKRKKKKHLAKNSVECYRILSCFSFIRMKSENKATTICTEWEKYDYDSWECVFI